MKTLTTITHTIFLSLLSHWGFGQDYYSEFQQHCQSNDTTKQLELLEKWEAEAPNDPELFTSYFNYYFLKSRKEIVALTDQPDGENLVISDSSGQPVGYLGSEIKFIESEVQKGFEKIDKGIELHPTRLDMRFGKIYVLGQLEDWEHFTNEIIETVKYSATIDNDWTWTHDEKPENGKEFFLNALQDYQVQLYGTGSDDLLVNMQNIANEILNLYPDHVESLSNLSITYLRTGEYDKGIEPLLKAEKLDPEDYIVLSNIAHGYKLMGDKKKAIEYYEKTIEFGNEDAKVYARQQIEMLKDEE